MKFNVGERHSFIIRPSLNIQDFSDFSEQRSLVRNRFGCDDIRFLFITGSRITGMNVWVLMFPILSIIVIVSIKRGVPLSMSLLGNYYDNETDALNEQYTFRKPDMPLDLFWQVRCPHSRTSVKHARSWLVRGVVYTEPLSRRFRMRLGIRFYLQS